MDSYALVCELVVKVGRVWGYGIGLYFEAIYNLGLAIQDRVTGYSYFLGSAIS